MITRILAALLCLSVLAACDGGSPLKSTDDDGSGNGGSGGDSGTPIVSDGDLPPGTASPTRRSGIFRREPLDAEAGNGYANDFRYDAATDTFFVDGLAFDGSQPGGVPYARATPGSLGGRYALYEAPATFTDPINGAPIGQFQHRALYGVSDSGQTEFAIVRTGNYIEYGFGGFLYQRNEGVTLPREGQATYTGAYGAIRDFDGQGGLEYASGRMQVDVDFSGFRNNCDGTVCADAVRGYVFDRAIFDIDGNDVTQEYLDALNEDNDTAAVDLPILQFRIGPSVMTVNGEVTGEAFSTFAGSTLEAGNYYAILSGDHTSAPGGEIVGVIVVESDDPRFQSVTVRETGGFIVNR